MQFFNKLLQWLFSLQVYVSVYTVRTLFAFKTPFRLFMALTWWTKWFGTCRYRDMMKGIDLPRSILLQAEFCPMLFLLTEMLWFDTQCKRRYLLTSFLHLFLVDLQSCFHSLPLIAGICLQFFNNAFKTDGGSAEPQLMMLVPYSEVL